MSGKSDAGAPGDQPAPDYEREQRRAWVRRIAAIPLILSLPVFSALHFNTYGAVIIGVYLTALGGVLLGPDIANLFGGTLSGLFWPDRAGPRKPAYGVPQSFMAAHKYAEAREAYEKIIREFPDEAKPHVELIKMAFLKLKDEALAREFCDRAAKSLGSASAREQVSAVYEMLSVEFKTPKREQRTLSLHHEDSAEAKGEHPESGSTTE